MSIVLLFTSVCNANNNNLNKSTQGDDLFSKYTRKHEYNKSFLVTSDPQLVCGSNCGLSSEESKKRVYDQYKLFSNNYSDVDALIINGDITEFGHNNEWGDFEDSIKEFNIPFYYGLGNHDIYNS